MSHHASSWAIDQTPTFPENGKPDPYGKLVLLVLADLAGQDGVLWHASTAVAEQACMPAPTVRKVMARLEENRLIARIERKRGDGSMTSSITVLAPFGGRGSMHPATDPKRFGAEIQAAIGHVTNEHGAVTSGYGASSSGYGGSEPTIEPVSEPVVVERAGAQSLLPIFDALQAAGFSKLEIGEDAGAIGLLISQRQPPADTDWDQVGQTICRGRADGKIRSERPVWALKFVLNGLDALPRIGHPSPHLFGEKPLTGHAALTARRLAIVKGEIA